MPDVLALLYHDVFRACPAESGFRDAMVDSYKLSERQFSQHLSTVAAAAGKTPILIRDTDVLSRCKAPFCITVDDGGMSYYSIVADALEAVGWRGHCLITTGQIGERGFLGKGHIRELHDRGHVIGTHTVSHPDRINECDWPVLLAEWRSSKACLEDVIGAEVNLCSVPGGRASPRVINAALNAGLKVLFTSEPEIRVRRVSDMLVLGRFSIRSSTPAAAVDRLVRRRAIARMHAWLDWNTTKALERMLGSGYRRMSNRVGLQKVRKLPVKKQ